MATVRIKDSDYRDVWLKYRRTRRKVYKNKLIETYLPLVRNVAERMLMTLPASVELDDLRSMGTFGLIEAIDRFDIDRGVLFKTYCVNRIRGAILDELRALDWVPRLVRHKSNTVDKLGNRMQSKLGRSATIFEMAAELELEVADYQRIEKDAKPVAMLSLSDDSSIRSSWLSTSVSSSSTANRSRFCRRLERRGRRPSSRSRRRCRRALSFTASSCERQALQATSYSTGCWLTL